MARLRDTIDAYAEALADIEASANQVDECSVIEALRFATAHVMELCAQAELELPIQQLASAREYFQSRTARVLEQSWIVAWARRWPRGYQGDFEILEVAYASRPASLTGVGNCIDRLILDFDLADAVRGRLAKMRELVQEEVLERGTGARIINLACGPARELVDLGGVLREHETHFVCVDHDPEALAYARSLLAEHGVSDVTAQFMQCNALRLANAESWRQTLGQADVIYSMGLFDYLGDRTVARLLRAAFHNLSPGGRLIVPFKDSAKYCATPFRWLMKWTGFLQRDTEQILDLLTQAGLAHTSVGTVRDRTGIILFLTLTR